MNVQQLRHIPLQEIHEDVEPSMGVVEAPGHLVIHGNVQDESLVLAGGDVTVQGYVGSAVIRAAGNITVHQGVAGQGYLDAGGDITARFANNSRFIAAGNIHVSISAMHCTLFAEGEIRIVGEEGLLVGGVTHATVRVVANRVGSIYRTPTVLRVGVSPLIRNEIVRLSEEVESLEKRLDATRKNIAYLEQVGSKSRYAERLPLYRLGASYLEEELSKQRKRYQITWEALKRADVAGDIQVIRMVHPGVILQIGWEERTLNEALEGVRFYETRGEISWSRLTSENLSEEESKPKCV